MGTISWPSIWFYCLFSVFVLYQKLHAKEFNGASVVFGFVLSLYALAGMLVGITYLVYYGWTVSWWPPVVALVLGALVAAPAGMMENLVGKVTISLAGFVMWPLSAYMMFHYIPK